MIAVVCVSIAVLVGGTALGMGLVTLVGSIVEWTRKPRT